MNGTEANGGGMTAHTFEASRTEARTRYDATLCYTTEEGVKRERLMHWTCYMPQAFDHSAIRECYQRMQQNFDVLSEDIVSITTGKWHESHRCIIIDCGTYSVQLVQTEQYFIL